MQMKARTAFSNSASVRPPWMPSTCVAGAPRNARPAVTGPINLPSRQVYGSKTAAVGGDGMTSAMIYRPTRTEVLR